MDDTSGALPADVLISDTPSTAAPDPTPSELGAVQRGLGERPPMGPMPDWQVLHDLCSRVVGCARGRA